VTTGLSGFTAGGAGVCVAEDSGGIVAGVSVGAGMGAGGAMEDSLCCGIGGDGEAWGGTVSVDGATTGETTGSGVALAGVGCTGTDDLSLEMVWFAPAKSALAFSRSFMAPASCRRSCSAAAFSSSKRFCVVSSLSVAVLSVASMPWIDAASVVTVAISAVSNLVCKVESRLPRIIERNANTSVSAANAKVIVCNMVLEPVGLF